MEWPMGYCQRPLGDAAGRAGWRGRCGDCERGNGLHRGLVRGDAARVERGIHPELAKRIVRPGEPPAGDRLDEMNALRLVYATRHAPIPAHQRRTDVTILDRFEHSASVRVDAKDWVEYLHMARWNGQWTIVNVLWEPRPEAHTP